MTPTGTTGGRFYRTDRRTLRRGRCTSMVLRSNQPNQRWGMYYEGGSTLTLEICNSGVTIPWTYDTNWHHWGAVLPNGQTDIAAGQMYLDGAQVEPAQSKVGHVLRRW